MKVGLVGSGHMGSGLGWALLQGGDEVFTTLSGRSERSSRLAGEAGLALVGDLDALVATVEVILVVTPPEAAFPAARSLARAARRTGARPVIADLNSIAPSTVLEIHRFLGGEGLELVAGSISGPPPWVRPGARLYFSGHRSPEVTGLSWRQVSVADLGPELGSAKALKMSTASVYKGLVGLAIQALRTAHEAGVLDEVLADLAVSGFDLLDDVVLAASKSGRYVAEMREIAAAQASAGLDPELFDAFAGVWEGVSTSLLAEGDPESTAPGTRSPADIVELLAARAAPSTAP